MFTAAQTAAAKGLPPPLPVPNAPPPRYGAGYVSQAQQYVPQQAQQQAPQAPQALPTNWWNQQLPDWAQAISGGMFNLPMGERPTWSEAFMSPEMQLIGAGMGGAASGMAGKIPGWASMAGKLPGGAGAPVTGARGVPMTGAAAGAVGGAASAASRAATALNWMKTHKLATTGLGALGGGLAYGNLFGGGGATPLPSGIGPYVGFPEAPGGGSDVGLPQPGGYDYTGKPFGSPEIVEVGGQKFWWNPMGQGGIGAWELISGSSQGMTPEQMMSEAERDRQAAMERLLAGQRGQLSSEEQIKQAEKDRQNQERLLRMQFESQMEQLVRQMEMERGMQQAGAAQSQASMYAQDPYKYWAQMGSPTPEAVARLTGGQIAGGEQFGQVPLSVPSSQWWGNLLPSEQQQIMGGVNWLGIDPYDYISMYQRMIPGLGSRQQMEPSWAR